MGTVQLPLPRDVTDAFRTVEPATSHPGLRLDKYCLRPQERSQEGQKKELDAIALCVPNSVVLREGLERRRTALAPLEAMRWSQKTAGPLTLHLARTSPLENAGIALHPIYGFVYLPGTGLKGLTRAWAETIWSPEQTDTTAAQSAIERIFGFAGTGDEPGASGSIVFHDAWPVQWPRLIVDILNSHHSQYYQGHTPPVEWEEKLIPVYFLAIGPGNEFEFALSPRRTGCAEDVAVASDWLKDALVHLGAGAKTAAGYGRFALAPGRSRLVQLRPRQQSEFFIQFDTPAFLAGANQKAEDCKLRTATRRGQLRHWWRTMHAGRLSTPDPLALESQIWGNTKAAGAVSLELEPLLAETPYSFNPSQIAGPSGIRKEGAWGTASLIPPTEWKRKTERGSPPVRNIGFASLPGRWPAASPRSRLFRRPIWRCACCAASEVSAPKRGRALVDLLCSRTEEYGKAEEHRSRSLRAMARIVASALVPATKADRDLVFPQEHSTLD